jgi:hypothetical protein
MGVGPGPVGKEFSACKIVRDVFGIYTRGYKAEKPAELKRLANMFLRLPLDLRQLFLRPSGAVE